MKQSIAAVILGLSCLLHTGASTAMTAEEVVQCMRKNFPDTVSIREIRLTTIDAAGSASTMEGRVYALLEQQEDGRALMRGTLLLEKPRNLYGASYLVRETDDYLRDGMFVYMPAVGRVRRISGNFADGPMMGTKFSYFEFKQMANAFGDLKGSYVRQESIEGRPTHILNFKPIEGVETRYTAVNAWIDGPTCLISKADFMQGNKIIKQLIAPAAGLRRSGEQWYHSEIRMHDLTDDARTIMNIDKVTTNEDLSSFRFSPKTFYETR